VRIGIASGEVVLDTAGCPFLGAALNLAARVMDLADGGRIMMAGDVAEHASSAASTSLYAHGEFKLKNIAEAVPVVELLWRDGMSPQEIRAT
jgi:class 3 adenylate cyclase